MEDDDVIPILTKFHFTSTLKPSITLHLSKLKMFCITQKHLGWLDQQSLYNRPVIPKVITMRRFIICVSHSN